MRMNKTLAVLQLYTQDRFVLTVDEIARAIDVSTSTAYRHLKELCGAGFLDAVGRGSYALGPAFIQYDHLLRRNDALIGLATPVMKRLLQEVDPGIDVVLSRMFNNCVLCIHQENGPKPHWPTRYVRGVAMPLFVGATSKAILAYLPDRTLRRIYLDNEEEIRSIAPDEGWKAFRERLRQIRKDGFSLTISEVQVGRVGLAAPIFRNGSVVASISLVMGEEVYRKVSEGDDAPTRVMQAAQQISRALDEAGARHDESCDTVPALLSERNRSVIES